MQLDPIIGVIVGQRYRILDLVGRGGMGSVYRAEHVKMGKVMAVKILSEELSRDRDLAKRFEREAETVSRLTAINTVQVFDFGTDQGMMYLVMEYLDGKDLAALLDDEGALPFERAAHIVIQAATGLAEAHEKGIIHRDLKPANIIVVRQGDEPDFVKVLDFGLATLKNLQRTKITKQGSLVGTPYYMSPEHIRGDVVDERADVYALGAVLYKLLTNQTPFYANTAMGVISKHLTEPPPCPSEVAPHLNIPAEADKICLKAMEKEPQDRYPTANALKRALKQAIGAENTNTEVARPKEREATTKKKSIKTVVIGARQVPVGTRSDFDRLKKKHTIRRIALALAAVAAAVIIGVFIALPLPDDPASEREPNNTSKDAGRLQAGVPLQGVLSSNDLDWYMIRGPKTPFAVSATVNVSNDVDIALQLMDPTLATPIASADAGGPGESETLYATATRTSPVYLLVRNVNASASGAPAVYSLVHHLYDHAGLELEPNNDPSTATVTATGITGGQLEVGDVDWFSIPTGASAIQVSSAAGIDIVLTVGHPSQGQVRVVNNFGASEGERVTLSMLTAPLFFSISEAGTQQSRSPRTYRIEVK